MTSARRSLPVSAGVDYCLGDRLDALDRPAWGTAPPPWAPGRREATARVKRMARDSTVYDDRLALLGEIDIFADLSRSEMKVIAEAAPMRTYPAGAMLYSPHQSIEALFILKRGRIRIFRVSPDGRALTTAIIQKGTIFGEMVLLGQQMYDNYAEALEEALVCVMSRADVHRFLLSDTRISARITEILGRRLAAMEQRLTDSVFKSVPQRIAATLCTLGDRAPGGRRPAALGGGPPQLGLTHEQVAALVGTSRETATKALGEFAERGLVRLGRGKIVIVDRPQLAAEAGEA
ncbi:MAG: cyclic nucleotide-binding domain-containing protein [Micromonosporaceae bacterium]|nr:cyclic nucleotide-binding domain-containing protein [Micromonosporaceae bacterium]